MADDTRPDALEALQGADPAQAAPAPDLNAIRERAQERSTIVPLRRRRTVITVGAVAAGVTLLAGTALGGVAIGRSTAPETVVAATAEDSLPVVGGASPPIPVVAGQAAGANAAAAAPETMSATAGGVADKAMIAPGYGISMVPGDGLPDEPGTAVGYRLDGSGIDIKALAQELARTFGVAGKPVKQEFGWGVGATDGGGPAVWTGNDATVSWSYSNPLKDPWSCGAVPEPAPDGSSPGAAPQACEPTVDPIGERAAVRLARDLLASLGVSDEPVDGIDIEWESGADDYMRWVTAWQRVEGQRTQLAWSFSFMGEEVLWANGFAAGLERTPAYPIVGARTAVQRSADPRFQAFGPTPLDYGIVRPMAETNDTTVSSDTAVSAAPSTPARQGNPRLVQVWWDPTVATGAELTLAQYWQQDGTLLILPAYRISTADDRGTWAIIAVAKSAVEFVD